MGGVTERQDETQGEGEKAAGPGWLTIVHGERRGANVEVPPTGLVLGRLEEEEGDGPRLALPDGRISRSHAKIHWGPLGWELSDLGSLNRGFVNGGAYTPNGQVHLPDGSLIRLGDTLLVFRDQPPPPDRLARGSHLVEPPHATADSSSDAEHVAFPGSSPRAATIRRQLSMLLRGDGPVLILGETGTGKEHVARALQRHDAPFVEVNCGQHSGALATSELFGYVRNAFTGASSAHPGLVEKAHGGVLFLDEIGELEYEVQAVLLRFLEDGSYRPVGATDLRRSNARVVAATNVDLEQAVARGRFRADLLARLNTAATALVLPPLRERREDVLTWAERFWRQVDDAGDRRTWSASAAECMLLYSWPLNLRELRGVMRSCATEQLAARTAGLAPSRVGVTLEEHHLPLAVRNARRGARNGTATTDGRRTAPPAVAAPRRTREPTKEEIERVLQEKKGNVRQTAFDLGVDRRKLYRLLDKHGISKGWKNQLGPERGLGEVGDDEDGDGDGTVDGTVDVEVDADAGDSPDRGGVTD